MVWRREDATDGPHEESGGGRALTMAVICMRPLPHTGQQVRSIPVSRWSKAATDSGRASSGGGWPRSCAAPKQRVVGACDSRAGRSDECA